MQQHKEIDVIDQDKVAVIGISGVFPGNRDVETFWESLTKGECLIQKYPYIRRYENHFSENANIIQGGYFTKIEEFDPTFFAISPRESKYLGLEQKYALMYVWKLLEDAGKKKEELAGKNISVFIGATDIASTNQNIADEDRQYHKMGLDPAMISARISYFFDWHGESFTINTACSSSLVAINRGCKSILNDGCEYAVAGGVNIISTEGFFLDTDALGMFSKNSDCRPFDDGASGILPGEAVGFVMLKSLSKAIKDGDQIYAVIEGSVCNQDGKSNGITAPNGKAQIELLKSNLKNTNITSSQVRYLESHGTATKLGDPIEFKSMSDVLDVENQIGTCSVGSVKANTGHTIASAGIVSMIKACLSLKYGVLAPQIKYEKVNQFINIGEGALYISKQVEKVDSLMKTVIAVNSFGYSGVNVNVLLSNYSKDREIYNKDSNSYMIPIAAKTKIAFEAYIDNFLSYLIKHKETIDLQDLSYTLINGRTHFKEIRKLYIVDNIEELIVMLEDYKKTKNANGEIDISISKLEVIEEYENGGNINLDKWVVMQGKIISLPTYSFKIESEEKPLIYSYIMEQNDVRVKEHIISEKNIVPAAMLLEEIRNTASILLDSPNVIMENICFLNAIAISDTTEIIIQYKEKDTYFSVEVKVEGALVVTGKVIDGTIESKIERLQVNDIEWIDSEKMYEFYVKHKISYGDNYRICNQLGYIQEKGKEVVIAKVQNKNIGEHSCFVLDSIMHSIAYMLSEKVDDSSINIPSYISSIIIQSKLHEHREIIVVGEGVNNSINIQLYNSAGEYLGALNGFKLANINTTINKYIATWNVNKNYLANSVKQSGYFDYIINLETNKEEYDKIISEIKESRDEVSILVQLEKNYESYFEVFEIVLQMMKAVRKIKSGNFMFVYVQGKGISHALNESLDALMRVVKNEMPQIKYKLLELSIIESMRLEEIIQLEYEAGFTNEFIKYNDEGIRKVPELIQVKPWEHRESRIQLGDTYLIIGGNGNIGRVIIEFLVKNHKVNIIFTGRSPMNDSIALFIRSMQKYNINITYIQMDVTNYEDVVGKLGDYQERINGVINCAGITKDDFIFRKDISEAREVLAVKIIGSLNIYKFFKASKIKFLILFSSVSGEMGFMGQCDYAYANQFVNCLANNSNSAFFVSAISWGYWKNGGIKMQDEMLEKYIQEGKRPIEDIEGCEALEDIINSQYKNIIVF